MCDRMNDKNKKRDDDMATLGIINHYAINEREAQLIANTSKTIVKKPSYANRFHLTPEERQKRAVEILNKWK